MRIIWRICWTVVIFWFALYLLSTSEIMGSPDYSPAFTVGYIIDLGLSFASWLSVVWGHKRKIGIGQGVVLVLFPLLWALIWGIKWSKKHNEKSVSIPAEK